MASSERAPGMEHIPKHPAGFIALRILQLIVGLICLGLSAYTVAIGTLVGNAVMVFTVRLHSSHLIPPINLDLN